MKKTGIFFAVLFACVSPAARPCSAQGLLTLDGYIAQVDANNAEVKSADLSIDATGKKILELDLTYSPYFSGSVNCVDDKSGVSFGSTLPVDTMEALSLDLGLVKKFATGSSVTFGYSDSAAKFDLMYPTSLLANTPAVSSFSGYEIKPFVKVEQSLLKDIGEGLTVSGINKAKAAARAGQYLQLFRKQQIQLGARRSYLALSLAREVVEFRKSSLARAEEILKWNEKKLSMDLADKSDLLQSQAAYKLRQLNLQMAVEDEINACRDFNELRNGTQDTVDEQLEKLPDLGKYYLNISTLTRSGRRADVLSAEELYSSAVFAEREAKYRSGPELSAFGYASLHGLALDSSDAFGQVADAEKPTYTVGLNFSAPFDLSTIKKVNSGYALDVNSAEQALREAELSESNDWNKLLKDWNNVKIRLNSAMEIRDIQNERVAAEKEKFGRGRTTTFELLAAQNDLDDSILSVYRLVLEEFLVFSQTELYDTAPLKN